MNLNIRKYNPPEDYKNLLHVIASEGDEWKDYLQEGYQEALEESITYVAYVDDFLCGYVRSMSDFGLFVIVIDLLVHKEHRGNAIGKKLLDCIALKYSNQDIYVLSDADGYYEKIGYDKEGSIFKVTRKL